MRCVAVHWETSVKAPHTHNICQVFASAMPVAYGRSNRTQIGRSFAVVLGAAVEATLCVACLHAASREEVRLPHCFGWRSLRE